MVGKFVIRFGLFLCLSGFLSVQASEVVLGASKGSVARAQFTTAIVDREPVDSVVILGEDKSEVYFFSDLINLKGQKVTHRWEYAGKVQSVVEFNVTSDRWRANSKIALKPNQQGIWTVVVVDGQGWPVKAMLFEYAEGVTKLLNE